MIMIAGGLTALLVSWVLTPPVTRLAWRIGAVDVPTDGRRMHTESIPRAGGIAVLTSLVIGCFLFCGRSSELLASLGGTALVFLVGLADDRFRLPAWSKLTVQIAAATGTVFLHGARGWGLLPGVFWIVTLTNAHNFIDGLDGLFAGTSATEGAALCLLFLATGRREAALPVLLAAGACLGFRAYNRPPARIFAGDCGSGSIGFWLGVNSLPAFVSEWRFGILAPLLIFAYPLTDLTAAVARRLLRGANPFAADRGHLHHRLCAAGLSQRKSAAILLSASAVTGIAGASLAREEYSLAAACACLFAALFLVLLRSRIFPRPVRAGRGG